MSRTDKEQKKNEMACVSFSNRKKEIHTADQTGIFFHISSSLPFLFYPNYFFNSAFIFLPLLLQKCLIELLRAKLFSGSHLYWCNFNKTHGYISTKWGILMLQKANFRYNGDFFLLSLQLNWRQSKKKKKLQENKIKRW